MDNETSRLGIRLRSFANITCEAFDTKELKREVAARNRRRKGQENTLQPTRHSGPDRPPGARKKKYHLRTIKHHFLGDNVNHIRRFGTTDSISTEPVGCMSLNAVSLTKLLKLVGRA